VSEADAAVTERTPPGAGALDALESTLRAHRDAMAAGDLPTMHATQARIRTWLTDPRWRASVRADADAARLRGALRDAALDAALAARGQAHAGRALACLGMGPAVYTPAGSLAAGPGALRGPGARDLNA
jgi:hypothetical protein